MVWGLQEAALLCALYAKLGTTVLPKLRGEYAFVVFDSRTVGVLLPMAVAEPTCCCLSPAGPHERARWLFPATGHGVLPCAFSM
jgi:hypothetical protein